MSTSGVSGTSATGRHAIYFMPADDSALARFGCAVLGRDAAGRTVEPLAGLPPAPDDWTSGPSRYGFHATLKAPFRLAPDADEMTLVDACDRLASVQAPCTLTGLDVRHANGFIALMQPGADPAVDALAADCVIGLEPFRAPLSAAELARRRPGTLDPAAHARLEAWGYPHVLAGFRFHMTLSASVPASRELEAWREALARRFAECVPDAPVLDRIALCREDAPGEPFRRIADFPLGGQGQGDTG